MVPDAITSALEPAPSLPVKLLITPNPLPLVSSLNTVPRFDAPPQKVVPKSVVPESVRPALGASPSLP
jgi:hypothetical protein